jgi:8-oxo-dGTP pyrophosphatase MutT (NUDIX family)
MAGGGDDEELRRRIRAEVLARRPVDERERRSIVEFVTAYDRLTDPFDEHADVTHVTASAIVVGSRGVVLHRHKRLGIWLQPGGHLDPGEPPWDAAWREAWEETGIAASHTGGLAADGTPLIAHVDVHPGPRGHIHLDLRYLLAAGDAEPVPAAGESAEVTWFTWDAALAVADDALVGILRALRGTLHSD